MLRDAGGADDARATWSATGTNGGTGPSGGSPTPWDVAEFDHLAPLALALARQWAASEGPAGPTSPPPARAELEVTGAGSAPDDVLARLTAVVAAGLDTRSPGYLGYLPSGGLPTAALADLLAAAANPYTGLPSTSPAGVDVDEAVLSWLCDVVGLPAGSGGTLTSGGSLATLTAVIAARESTGLDPAEAARHVVYLGEYRHHCVDAALRWSGLATGAGGVRQRVIGSDAEHRMDASALREAMDADAAAGLVPWLVVATAGTTGTGAIDPLVEVATHARRHGAWLHVDAAFGGLYALAASARPRLAGLGLADSVVVDPHKGLFLPYGLGALLVRDRTVLSATFATAADYLPDDVPGSTATDEPDGVPGGGAVEAPVAHLGLELTRPWRGLRAWLPLQVHGADAFARQLEDRLRLARRAHALLLAVPGLMVGPEPDLSVVTFAVRGAGGAPDDARTLAVVDAVNASGERFASTTVAAGHRVARLAVGSFRTGPADVEAAVAAVRDAVADAVSDAVSDLDPSTRPTAVPTPDAAHPAEESR